MRHSTIKILAAILAVCCIGSMAFAKDDLVQWHENLNRNNVVLAEDLPDHLGDDNRLWHLELQGRPFFNIITIEGNRVYCGMSAKNLPNPEKDGGAILCLDLETGKEIWTSIIGERGGAYGLSVVPLIEEEGIYVIHSNTAYFLNHDGEIQWESNEITQDYFGEMHGTHSTGLIIGDYWWIPTGHATGSDCNYWINNALEQPWHPNVVVLDKRTGKRVAQDNTVTGPQQHGTWSSLSSGVVNGQRQVYWGDGYGYIHAYEVPDSFPEGKITTLKEVWYADANPKHYRVMDDGTPMSYAFYMGTWGPKDKGPCEIIATPVFQDGKVYATLARDKAYGLPQGKRRLGEGAVVCIDASGEGDVTETHKIWENTDVARTFSTPSIYKGLILVSTHAGYVNCLDLKTGESIWQEDMNATIWNYFQAVGDDKLFVTNERRDFFIMNATPEGGVLYHEELDGVNNPQPGITNGVLVVGSTRSIAAYGGPEYMKTHESIGAVEK
ncbi:MAG: PQQ-binding-like beta-propeller repeat protein [Candidatus Sumerlaeia bacterium]